jgi:mono/diheme cytochrome c family protein
MKKLTLLSASLLAARLASAADAPAKVDFAKDIKPILAKSCVECHGPDKQKGKLRLDSREAAIKGGDAGTSIVPGKADKSEFYKRIILPAGHDDFMPKKGDPLTKAQIELVKNWIDQGADWPVDKTAAKPGAGPTDDFARLKPFKPSAEETAAIKKIETAGLPIRPVAMNVTWVEANLGLLGTNVTDTTVAMFKDVPSLVYLNLANTKVTDAGLANVKGLKNLLTLHLENTQITDAAIANLAGLENLVYLNLYNTKVTDAAIDSLAKLKNLRNLYLWQTKITDDGAKKLKAALPKTDINRGWDLASVIKPAEPKKEEPKKEEPKKPEAKKDDAKKPDAKKEEPKKADAPKPEPKKDGAKKEEPKKSEGKKEDKK